MEKEGHYVQKEKRWDEEMRIHLIIQLLWFSFSHHHYDYGGLNFIGYALGVGFLFLITEALMVVYNNRKKER